MEVKPGIKQTAAGVVPEDWTARELGDLVTFLDGRRRPVKDADRAKMRGSIPYYGASGVIDYVNGFLFDEDLILLSEDGENILSRNSRLAFAISGKTWVNNHAHVLRPNPDVNIGYLTDYLESLNYEKFNSGTAQPKLNKHTCARILVSLPPTKAEQVAIAGALYDADALIESLEQLLAKKRHLKQGAMQELLTGKTRLPGFSGERGGKALGNVATLQRGFDLSHRMRRPGSFPIVTSSGIEDTHCEAKVNGPGVVTGRYGTIGEVFYVPGDFWPLNTTLYVRDFHGHDPRFISYLLQTIDFHTHSGKSGVPGVNRNDLHQIEVPLPPTKAEEEAIAEVLSDADALVKSLEQLLAKKRHLKQGMMQKLFTGTIRLV